MPMLKNLVKSAARLVAPRWAACKEKELWTKKHARLLRNQYRRAELETVVDALLASRVFPACQKRAEILRMLGVLKDLRPKFLCEIGSASGGTLFLLCQVAAPDALILSLDINHAQVSKAAFPCFRRESQRVLCLAADSHSVSTLSTVVNYLAGNRLDFLFIDGDHSWDGVKADYEMYAPLLRQGGIVAFHDIVPDSRSRYGASTGADAGDVPRYWAGLKARSGRCEELIEDPNQDGYGIGVVHWGGEDGLGPARA